MKNCASHLKVNETSLITHEITIDYYFFFCTVTGNPIVLDDITNNQRSFCNTSLLWADEFADYCNASKLSIISIACPGTNLSTIKWCYSFIFLDRYLLVPTYFSDGISRTTFCTTIIIDHTTL